MNNQTNGGRSKQVIKKATPLPTPEGGWSKPQDDTLEQIGEETDENGVKWTVYRVKKRDQHDR